MTKEDGLITPQFKNKEQITALLSRISPEVIELKRDLEKESVFGLGVDIDDTLAKTQEYWADRMIKYFGLPRGLTRDELYYGCKDFREIPDWKDKPRFSQWIKAAINSNKLQKKLGVISGALSSVNQINQFWPIKMYLSVRPKTIESETIEWLKLNNFLKAPVILMPKETDRFSRSMWKAAVLEYLYPQISGMIDDDLKVVRSLSSEYQGTIFILGKEVFETENDRVISCQNWDEVVEKAREVRALSS